MRRGLIVLALTLLTVSLSTPVPAEEATGPWYVLRLTAGSSGASRVSVPIGGTIRADGQNVLLLGIGFGSKSLGGVVDVSTLGGGPHKITTTSDLGGYVIDLRPAGGDTDVWFASGQGFFQLAPREQAGVIVFATAGSFDASPIGEPQVESGSVTADVSSGTGSRPLLAARPEDGGVGVGIDSLAIGNIEHREDVADGIVGGFVLHDFCRVCRGTWHEPGGFGYGWRSIGTGGDSDASGYLLFAGPPGRWAWDWTGAGQNDDCLYEAPVPAYGAYAPVGDLWKVFGRGVWNASTASACV
jgi:hypothetical protein